MIEIDINKRCAAEHAVTWVLARMQEPAVYFLLGDDSGVFHALTASRALTTGESQEQIRERCRPTLKDWDKYMAARQRTRCLLDYLHEQLSTLGGEQAHDCAVLTVPVWLLRGKPEPVSADSTDVCFNN